MTMRKDLVDVGDSDYDNRQREFMECQECGNEIGGTRGDYWQLPMNHVFACPECGSKDVILVNKCSYLTEKNYEP